jgi:hypothetical protein
MKHLERLTRAAAVLGLGLIVGMLTACGGGGAAGNGNQPQAQQNLLDQINQRFPFTPNQPFDVIFACQRSAEFIFREIRMRGLE